MLSLKCIECLSRFVFFVFFCLQLKNMPSAESINLCSYNFDDLLLSDDATVLAAARIFYDCGFVDRYRINQKVCISS